MIAVIDKNKNQIKRLCSKYKISKLYVFGSALKITFDPGKSDIDLAVIFNDDIPIEDTADYYFNFIEELELLLGNPIDLVTLKSIRNPIFKEELQKTMIPLYAA